MSPGEELSTSEWFAENKPEYHRKGLIVRSILGSRHRVEKEKEENSLEPPFFHA
jgi:hypothetical protein